MASLAQYMAAVKRSGVARYPGSAALAASWLRPQDRALLLAGCSQESLVVAFRPPGRVFFPSSARMIQVLRDLQGHVD